MKHKWTLWNVICLSGVIWFFIAVFMGIYIKWQYYNYDGRLEFAIKSIRDIEDIITLSFFFWGFVFLKNLMHIEDSKPIGLLTWLSNYKYEPPEISTRKRKAQHPPIDEYLLSQEPDGLVLGKYHKYFVRVPIKKGNIQNMILMGAPGCGKSVLLITTLLYQLTYKVKNKTKDSMTFYCIDIKPELAMKSCFIKGNKRVKVMNPVDRSTYGWNPYYRLNKESTPDDIMAELDVIARALIDAGKGEKNEFFYESARTIMKAVLFYTYKNGRSFMQGLDYLMNENISTLVSNTIEKTENKPEYRLVSKLLKPYADKQGEAFEGIELAFRQSLSCFTTQMVQFFLDGNPRKASPNDLEKKVSVFFSIPETKIDEYKCLLRLITMQIMQHCSGRSEDSHMLTLVIDEAARLGSINWVNFLATSRSRQCATILAFQSYSQMQTCWSKEEAKSLFELCRIVAVLSCTDPDTAKMMSEWAGTYKEEKQSHNNGGKNDGTYSTSYDDKKILESVDIMTLQDTNEILLFIKGKYYRTDVAGARYFNIKMLNELSKSCVAYNRRKER